MTSEEPIDRIESAIEKQNKGIQDLILVSGTGLRSIQELTEAQRRTDNNLNALIEQQKQTDERLHILLDTLNRFMKGLRGGNGHGP
jgi:hypothetical protein